MYIDQIILQVLTEVVDNVYWYQAPTPGEGTYAVINQVSDIAKSNKDIHTTPHVTSVMRIQISVYSDTLANRRVYSDHITHKLRTTRDVNEAEATLISAHDQGSKEGFMPVEGRFYDHQDWRIFYNQTIS